MCVLLNEVRTVCPNGHYLTCGDRHTGACRSCVAADCGVVDRGGVAGVVVQHIQLGVWRSVHSEVGAGTCGQRDCCKACFVGSAVHHSECLRRSRNCHGSMPCDRRLDDRAKVGVCCIAPHTGLIAGANEFDA